MTVVQQASAVAASVVVPPAAARILSSATFGVEDFVACFSVLVEAAGSTKPLRELLLSLAVRGLLTQRMPPDDEVDVLLEDVERHRVHATADNSSRSGLRVATVPAEEGPFVVPETWRWVRLGDLGIFVGGGTPSKANAAFWKGSIPWVSPKDMKRPYIEDAEDHISRAAVHGSAVKLVPPRSLLFVVRGMILAHSFPTAITTREVTINQDMKALVLARSDLADYLLRATQQAKRRVLQQVERSSHGTCRLDTSVVETLLVPVPPLAEQKRIVARVDQLMGIIDEFEDKQSRKRDVGARFTKASLGMLASAEGPEELDAAWKRVTENWGVVLDRPEKVSEIRTSVLDLAVQGLLVRRDPSDGAAQDLVDQCPERQRELEGNGTFKRADRVPSVVAEDRSLRVPADWAWERLGNLCRFIDYRGKTPTKLKAGIRLITAKNVRMGHIRSEPEEFVSRKDYDEWMTRGLPRNGDLLFTTEAPLGNVAIYDFAEPIALAQRIIALHPYCDLQSRFLMIVMMSPWFQRTLSEKATGMTATGIKASKLKSIAVPLASLAEQKRIVAKVEQMMNICDGLEAKLRRVEDRASRLVEAVVQEMLG